MEKLGLGVLLKMIEAIVDTDRDGKVEIEEIIEIVTKIMQMVAKSRGSG